MLRTVFAVESDGHMRMEYEESRHVPTR
jgi:hypothetical protein